ncbi:MAG: DUF4153 domain-containing protein [Candidatus Eisenbacteria bacterium]|nr:DUF4153 domain-containing protein [Candidatus Eisenbacteria bacterium]
MPLGASRNPGRQEQMMFDLESQIRKWRRHIQSTGSLGAQDVEELESHLRDGIDELTGRGVNVEEAFLVSIHRMGDAAALQHEFTKVSTERVWRQLLLPAADEHARRKHRNEIAVVVLLVLLGGLLAKIPALFGYSVVEENALLYAKNAALFAFPPVAIYLIWKRALSLRFVAAAVATFGLFAVAVNAYPSYAPHHTEVLAVLHVPIALLLLLMALYAGPGWRRADLRLDFVRFAGEAFIYSVLIGLGGLVLVGVAGAMFQLVGIDIVPLISDWIAVFGAAGVFVFSAYLVEKKKGVIETIAPVLARIFTPLFLVVLLALVVTMALTGQAPSEDRELLIMFDIVLALVLGLVLYTMSARDTEKPADWWDAIVLGLVVMALIADAVALSGIVGRLATYGFSPNKAAALGENVALMINLLLLAAGYFRFLSGRLRYQTVVDWQMSYLPVHALWAAFVALAFPPLFEFA